MLLYLSGNHDMHSRASAARFVWEILLVFLLLTRFGTSTLSERYANEPESRLCVNWENVVAISNTTATLQVVVNPILNTRTSPVAWKLFDYLHDLNADLVRYVPWYPYPKIGVAELEPPDNETQATSWDFTYIQQQFYDTFQAVTSNRGKRIIINFSTQPAWMFNTTDWSYDRNINRANWHYANGHWVPETTQLVAEYYGRLASWILHGSFVDEFGREINGGPAYGDRVTHWEVFNEPTGEHSLSWTIYNEMYDAIVQEIRRVADPNHQIKFVGMALIGHTNWEWWRGFLTLDNHHPAVRDAVTGGYASFHWYGHVGSRTDVSTFEKTFEQLKKFLADMDQIVALRDELSPTTKLSLDEAGVIPPDDNDMSADASPPIYYNMVAGVYTALWCELSVKGVDIVGSSQFCGCPAIPSWDIPNRQYPGVSMTNWTTGDGNPRYWALKLILKYFGPGDQIMETSYMHEQLYIQARITKHEERALIIVNKSSHDQFLVLSDVTGSIVHVVDGSTHDGPWKEFRLLTKTVMLKPFAVVVVWEQTAKRTSGGNVEEK